MRYSLKDPHAYIQSNLMGHLNVLEFARHRGTVKHIAYASSSSVYGEREPSDGFKESDRVREPASLYAATKLGGEMISESYARLYDIPQTGLRFFTVYGPWGRPDMAYWIFTQKILAGDPITLFAPDIMQRDFTYIDDIIRVIPQIVAHRPKGHEIYNLGNSAPNKLLDLVGAIERATGKKRSQILNPNKPAMSAQPLLIFQPRKPPLALNLRPQFRMGWENLCVGLRPINRGNDHAADQING